MQKGFGWAVAAREALYLLTTLVALRLNPAFLLVDVGAPVRDTTSSSLSGYSSLAFYVLAPDKFVAFAVYDENRLDSVRALAAFVFSGGMLLDLCGVGALIAGLAAGSLPGALAVGYVASTLAGLFFATDCCPCVYNFFFVYVDD